MGLSECFYTSEELKVKSDFLPSTIWNAYTIQILRIQIYREHSPCLLPVHWKGLTGRCVNNKVQQSWAGAIEIHTSLPPVHGGWRSQSGLDGGSGVWGSGHRVARLFRQEEWHQSQPESTHNTKSLPPDLVQPHLPTWYLDHMQLLW